MKRIIWWLRRDLRSSDNLVLHQALQDGAAVIPVFVLDPALLQSRKLAPARKQFLLESLAEVDRQLRARGSYLVVRAGRPADELVQLAAATQADAVYFHKDYTPYARRRDGVVTKALRGMGIRTATFNDIYLADPEQVVKDDGSPFRVYSPYRVRFEKVIAVPPAYTGSQPLNTPPDIPGLAVAALAGTRDLRFMPGGSAAGEVLAQDFIARANGLALYSDSRNQMGADATSHLSPHLHFGTVSVRALVRAARSAFPAMPLTKRRTNSKVNTQGEHAKAWVDELVWREFYNHVLYHFPDAARRAFRSEFADLDWRNDAAQFQAWCQGRTGYPIVDAAMRQLQATGWMHNRARMVVASFLTKDLLIDWRWGERYFLQNLIDGDVASNNGGWQWSAGTGTDAQPFFRIFNPVLQGMRFDPDGAYVRRYVPELARVPRAFIHAPWTMSAETAQSIGYEFGVTYPPPMVDHGTQRESALALYRMSDKPDGSSNGSGKIKQIPLTESLR